MNIEKIYLVFFLMIIIFLFRKKTYFGIDKKIGRGIFCNNIIFPGEIVEISPTLEITDLKTENPLKNYIFTDKKFVYVGFGIASMFNHSDDPNVVWHFDKNKNIVFTATKLILAGQQLYISYGKKYWKYRIDKI